MRRTLGILACAFACAASIAPHAASAQQTPTNQAEPKTALLAPLRCAEPIARMASVQGLVELRGFNVAAWQRAQLNDALCLNDSIRVGPNSRASFRYTSDITVQLDQNTFVSLIEAKDKASTWTQMWRGALHFISRSRKPFRVITPFANASVEGTEVYIALATDRADLTVFEGKLDVANDAGQVLLSSGESAIVQGLETIADDDQFRTLRAEAPRKVLIAKPRDAVQWALYYPPIIDLRGGENVHPGLRAASEKFRAGDTAAAFAELDSVPADAWDAQYFIYRASLLLYVGREQEAQAELAQALQKENARQSDVYALQTIIAIVQNDKEQGLALAQKAVATDPASAAAQIALSYAQQSIFKLEPALASAAQAAKLDPSNALAHARIAELQLSQGDLDQALTAAKKATELNPNLARTQSILGFSYLTRIDTKNAKATFEKAIQLDSADPLPHMGLGLAKIREGKLAEGRQDIEQAVILDPNNSLIRSYVGKAYYEEKRDELAGEQFEIAKELDPRDPTPWFYSALQKQSENRPLNAIENLRGAIVRNEHRAPARSKLLLDADRGSRAVDLAKTYQQLGLDDYSRVVASQVVLDDPSNSAAYGVASDSLLRVERREIARASLLLQKQAFTETNASPLQPHLPYTDLHLQQPISAYRAGLNEYLSLFERNRVGLSLWGILGNFKTRSDELVLSGIHDRLSYGIGQFHYETTGFRPNNQVEHDIRTGFAQLAVTPSLAVQVEARKRATNHGDISQDIDPNIFSRFSSVDIEQDTHRFGVRLVPMSNVAVVASHAVDDTRRADTDQGEPGLPFDNRTDTDTRATQADLRLSVGREKHSLLLGTSRFRSRFTQTSTTDWSPSEGVPCPPEFDVADCVTTSTSTPKSSADYVYVYVHPLNNLGVQIGVSNDVYDNQDQDPLFRRKLRRLNPKLGAIWNRTTEHTLRATWFKGLKRPYAANQTLEPVHLAGFTQIFDDQDGALIESSTLGVDLTPGGRLSLGGELMWRDITLNSVRSQKEKIGMLYAGWVLTERARIRAVGQFDSFQEDPSNILVGLLKVDTLTLPISFTYSPPKGFFAELTIKYLNQRQTSAAFSNRTKEREQAGLLDLAIGYRFSKARGNITLTVSNVADETFSFRDDNFRLSEQRASRYVPARTVLLQGYVVF